MHDREPAALSPTASKRGSWREQLARRVRRPEDLPPAFRLFDEERDFFASGSPCRDGGDAPPAPPFAVTGHLLSLIDPQDPQDPIRRQFFPRREERIRHPDDLEDPLGEAGAQAAPGLLHRYPDRALLLASSRCAAYCRHCFRRGLAGRDSAAAGGVEALAAAAAYVERHWEVRELILSGGDPLMRSDRSLQRMLARFRRSRPDLAFRIHTRLPAALPERVTPELASLLARFLPLRVVIQVNHPRELDFDCRRAVRRLLQAGIPVLNQSVLLKGVNSDPEVLAELFRRQAEAGIRPYYLFQPDQAAGTSHLRPSLEEGLHLFERVRRLCPPELLPRYMRDLPGGGGKVVLAGSTS